VTPQSAPVRHQHHLGPGERQGDASMRDKVRRQTSRLHHEEHVRLREKSLEVNTTNHYRFPPASFLLVKMQLSFTESQNGLEGT